MVCLIAFLPLIVHDLQRNFWATVCKMVRPVLSDHYLSCPVLSCLSVMLVYCGQTVGWIKMKLGMQVGLGHGHIVLGEDPAPLLQKGAQPPQFSAHICCDQMAGWIKMPLGREVGLSPSDIVRWGPSSPSSKRPRSPPPSIFSAHVYCGQTAGWMKMPLGAEVDLSQATLC